MILVFAAWLFYPISHEWVEHFSGSTSSQGWLICHWALKYHSSFHVQNPRVASSLLDFIAERSAVQKRSALYILVRDCLQMIFLCILSLSSIPQTEFQSLPILLSVSLHLRILIYYFQNEPVLINSSHFCLSHQPPNLTLDRSTPLYTSRASFNSIPSSLISCPSIHPSPATLP